MNGKGCPTLFINFFYKPNNFPELPPNYKIVKFNKHAKFVSGIIHIDESDFFRLERPIIYQLNDGEMLKAYSSDSGWLCVYHMPDDT